MIVSYATESFIYFIYYLIVHKVQGAAHSKTQK